MTSQNWIFLKIPRVKIKLKFLLYCAPLSKISPSFLLITLMALG